MASQEAFNKAMALIYISFPNRKPQGKPEQIETVIKIWEAAFSCLDDKTIMRCVTEFITTTKKLYPDDNPIAMILDLAKPKFCETAGDVVQLANEAASLFGSYREDEALKWIESKSSLCHAVISRFGFKNYCMSEEPDVARGQLRRMFDDEKKRADDLGMVVSNANTLSCGKPIQEIASNVVNLMPRLGQSSGGDF